MSETAEVTHRAQQGRARRRADEVLHYGFFETPQTLHDWVERSREHQAWVIRLMAEAFRRDRRLEGDIPRGARGEEIPLSLLEGRGSG